MDLMARFLGWMDALAVSSPFLYWATLAGLLALAALLLGHVFVSVRAALEGSARPGRPVREAPSPPSFARDAEHLASEGRYLEAARRLQLACIALLLDRGLLALRRFEPNATLRRRIAGAALPPEQRRELISLLQQLETRLFRDPIDDRPLYDAWRSLHGRLVSGRGPA